MTVLAFAGSLTRPAPDFARADGEETACFADCSETSTHAEGKLIAFRAGKVPQNTPPQDTSRSGDVKTPMAIVCATVCLQHVYGIQP